MAIELRSRDELQTIGSPLCGLPAVSIVKRRDMSRYSCAIRHFEDVLGKCDVFEQTSG